MQVIRVVLVDDHPVLRRGMRTFLAKTDDIEIVGEASDGRKALELIQNLPADVVLVDVEMPGMDGLKLAREISENQLPVRILALSAHDDTQFVLGMLESGAAGYLTKDEAPDLVIDAIRRVAAGEDGWVSPSLQDQIAATSDGPLTTDH